MTAAPSSAIRGAFEPDLERVVSVLRAANAEFEDVVPATFYCAYLTNVLDLGSRLAEAELLVAEHEGRIVGAITLYPDASVEGWGWPPNWTGIRAVAVEPKARGLGIGRRLAKECIDRSRELGADAVCLHTASFMQAAIAMYESAGFRRVPEFDQDAGELLGLRGLEPPIAALAYRRDL